MRGRRRGGGGSDSPAASERLTKVGRGGELVSTGGSGCHGPRAASCNANQLDRLSRVTHENEEQPTPSESLREHGPLRLAKVAPARAEKPFHRALLRGPLTTTDLTECDFSCPCPRLGTSHAADGERSHSHLVPSRLLQRVNESTWPQIKAIPLWRNVSGTTFETRSVNCKSWAFLPSARARKDERRVFERAKTRRTLGPVREARGVWVQVVGIVDPAGLDLLRGRERVVAKRAQDLCVSAKRQRCSFGTGDLRRVSHHCRETSLRMRERVSGAGATRRDGRDEPRKGAARRARDEYDQVG